MPLIGSLASLGALYWKSQSHPANLVLLALFTLMESLLLGTVVSVVDVAVLFKAVVLTTLVFGALTAFTLQTRYNFESLASYLYYGLMLLVGVGLVQLFFPYNHTFELLYSVAGCAIFSGYILFDTYLIQQRYVILFFFGLIQFVAGHVGACECVAVPRRGQPVPLGAAQYVECSRSPQRHFGRLDDARRRCGGMRPVTWRP